MADEMRALATKENQLAAKTLGQDSSNQSQSREQQQRISDEAAVASQQMAQLSAPASSQLGRARQTMQNLDNALKTDGLLGKTEQRGAVVNAEHQTAQDFAAAADTLQKQASAMAGMKSDGNAPSAQDKATSEITKASGLITSAEEKMSLAMQIMQSNETDGNAKELIGQAKSELSQADSMVSALGAEAKDVAAKLKSAEGKADVAESKAGTTADQTRASRGLGSAKDDAARAFASLQDLSNRLTAQSSVVGAPVQVSAAGTGGLGMGRPGGDRANADTSYSALATFTNKDREALAVLEHEKTPAEYDAMVRQYRKNLANGELPIP